MIGPPGSGKTTYTHGMAEFLRAVGRDVAIVNLDPAGSTSPYTAAANISELVTVDDAMASCGLGPNGAMIFCMEVLEKNVDSWLLPRLRELVHERPKLYLLFDLPGQVELFTHHPSLQNVLRRVQRNLGASLVAVHLVDALHCAEPGRLVSVILLSLSAMLRLELPHINVLSKIDLVRDDDVDGGALRTQLDLRGDEGGLDLSCLLPIPGVVDSGRSSRFQRLNAAVSEIVEEFGLVSFQALSVLSKERMVNLVRVLDKAIGFVAAQDG